MWIYEHCRRTMAMREGHLVLIALYFYCTAVVIVIGILSRTLMGTETTDTYVTHGLWQLCRKPIANPTLTDCSWFDWQNEVKDSVAADRVRTILAFGTMTFIAAVVILTSPFFFPLFLSGRVSSRVMFYTVLGVYVFMGLMGSVTWIVWDTYFDDVIVDDYAWFKYGWGAYVFMVGTGMTSLSLPIMLSRFFCPEGKVHPDIEPLV